MEEIYKDLNSPKSKEFEQLLNSAFSKSKVEEGKIVDGTVTKITDKLIFIEIVGAKSEGTLDINEFKFSKDKDDLKIGKKIPVLIEKLEDKVSVNLDEKLYSELMSLRNQLKSG